MENSENSNKTEALIVEDEIDICFLLTGILRKKDLKTAFVNTIEDAKNTLITQNPQILILDNNLPDGFGIDFIKFVKQHSPLTKIVMITANDTTTDRDKAMKAGANFFIGKPFTRETINNTLDILIAAVDEKEFLSRNVD